MRFRKTCLLVSLLLLTCVALTAFLLSCTKHRSANPMAPVQDPTVFISSLTADPPLIDVVDGFSTITVQVVDADGDPLSGQTVQFSTTLGTVDEEAVTNSSGYATAILQAGSSDGMAKVTARVGDVTRSVEVQVGAGTGMITADPRSILADGVSTSTVTARILDDDGNPQSEVTAYFYTTCGQITPSAQTDADGEATAILTSAVSSRDTAAYVSVSTSLARGIFPENALSRKERGSGAPDDLRATPKAVASESAAELAKVNFRGINLSLTADEEALSADGLSNTELTAIMTETTFPHAPVVGLPLTFVSDLGSISPREVETDEDGRATATLTSDENAGVATVRVEYRTAIADSASVTFRPLTLTLSSDEISLLADGQATANVTARLLNSEGNPVSGVSVEFTADLGSISSPHTTGEDGRATATLTSSTNPGTCHIVARFGNSASDSLSVEFSSYDIALVAEPTSILADGADSSRITVVLKDGEGQPLADQSIHYATDLGAIHPQEVVTDQSGQAQATLTSWAASVDSQAVVTATFKGSSNQVSVSLRGVHLGLSVDPTAIVANGTSIATVTANLQETTSGLPLPSKKISFQTNLGTITEEVLTNNWGVATATLTSGTSSGTATITAQYGSVLSQTSTVEFLPTAVHQVSLEAEQELLLADGEDQMSLTATVIDADAHPIKNVTVSFECEAGSITTSAITDTLGRAVALFTSPTASEDQTLNLSASVGSIVGETQVSLKGVSFSLQLFDQEILADGVSSTTVTAEIKETTSGLPLVGRTVKFRCFNDLDEDGVQDGGEVSLGQIDSSGVTDASGQARVTLTSEASSLDLQATIRGETEAGLVDTASLPFVGVVLEMSPIPSSIVANGVSFSVITVTLRENVRGYGIPSKEIDFSTNLGQLQEQRGTTDENGQVAAILVSSTSPGAAVVTATYGDTISQTTTVNFTIVEPAIVQVESQEGSIRADGVDSTTIDVSVLDADENPIADLPVVFQTSLGTIDAQVLTDEQGQAQATLIGASSGVDTVALVTVTAGMTVESVEVALRGVSLGLSFQPTSLLADGSDSATVTALYQETTGGVPIVGETIQFVSFEDLDEDGVLDAGESLLGTVTPEAITNADGQATVTFMSSADSAYRRATIRATTAVEVTAHTTIDVLGVHLNLSAEDSSLVASGSSTTDIVATLMAQGQTGPSGPIEGKGIDFQTNLGSLSPEGGVTGSTGQVHTTLTSSPYPGTALVTARCGSDIAKSVQVDFMASVPDSIILAADPPAMPADGVSSSEITANVIDVYHNPVSDGTLVTFETSAGMITESDVTTAGVAHAMLVSCTTPGQVFITAQAALPDSGFINSDTLLVTLTPNEAASIILSTEDDTLLADGSSTTTVTAQVLDLYGNPMSAGQEVNFQTTLGSITEQSFTDDQGTAEAVLTSGTTTGAATVSATAGEANAHMEIYFISGQAANIVLISVSACSIGVQGSGDPETSTLTFEVRDNNGIPLDMSQQVTVDFEIVGPSGGGEFLQPTSDLTDELGQVHTTLNSGTVAKTVKVKATNDSLGISSEAINIAIHGGPPDEDHFSVVPQYKNFAGWRTFGLENTITAFVGDQYGNPVPQGTSVYFSTTGGIIVGSATTNALGEAMVTLVSADPLPVSSALDPSTGYTSDVSGYCDFTSPKNGDGQAVVFAQTVDRLNNPIWTWTLTIFSGYTGIYDVDPTTFAIPNGGSQGFTFSVHDLNGNPLTEGTNISVDATVGELVGDVDVTLPDTQSAGWTSFSFLLMDGDAGETDPAETCVLTISVSSDANGNASTIIMGTVD